MDQMVVYDLMGGLATLPPLQCQHNCCAFAKLTGMRHTENGTAEADCGKQLETELDANSSDSDPALWEPQAGPYPC